MTTDLRESHAASIQPVVLVGGKSTRFGRDKLREVVSGSGRILVHHPIEVLREVFGARVALVGDCHPDVAALADVAAPDRYPATGPLGGILAALEVFGCPVFVLAGDLPALRAPDVRTVLAAAAGAPEAWAVIGAGDQREPCIGLYRLTAAGALRAALDRGGARLGTAIPDEHLVLTPLPAESLVNVNRPADLVPPGQPSGE